MKVRWSRRLQLKMFAQMMRVGSDLNRSGMDWSDGADRFRRDSFGHGPAEGQQLAIVIKQTGRESRAISGCQDSHGGATVTTATVRTCGGMSGSLV